MNIQELKQILLDNGYTCVLSDEHGENLVSSTARGVKPLIDFIESGKNFNGFIAADKVVGKAAALLYACMGIKSLYALTVSESAVEVCEKFGITLLFDTKTPAVINRKGDDICPMEKTVLNIFDPKEALAAIKRKLSEL